MSLFLTLSFWISASAIISREQCMQIFPHRTPQSVKHYQTLFDPIFVGVGNKRNIDPTLLKAIAYCETGLDPCARSKVGAQGIMQFMPKTFDLVSAAAGAEVPYDPIDSIESAGVYLSALINYWKGDIHAVIASYNAGPKNVALARAKGRLIPQIDETIHYVACVLAAQKRMQRTLRAHHSPTSFIVASTALTPFAAKFLHKKSQGELA